MQLNVKVRERQLATGEMQTYYFVPVKSTKADGTELVKFLNVKFRKCPPPIESCRIEEKYSFFSVYERRNGEIDYELIIMNYSIIETEENKQLEKPIDEEVPF